MPELWTVIGILGGLSLGLLALLTAQHARINGRLDRFDGRLDGFNARLDQVLLEIGRMRADVQELRNEVRTTNERLSEHEAQHRGA